MLTIRGEQMGVIEGHVFDAFVSELVVRLRAYYSTQVQALTDNDIEAFVRTTVQGAEVFQIRAAANLEPLVDFAFAAKCGCYDRTQVESAIAILSNMRLSETERINRLSEYRIFGNAP